MMRNGTNESKRYVLDNNGYKFIFSTSKVKDAGYRIFNTDTKEAIENEKMYNEFFKLYEAKKVIKVKKNKIDALENETKPPGRFTQASLIKKMKETGIGRPSTYSPTTKLLFDRRYVISESSSVVPTELGELVVRKLLEQFEDILNAEYTSEVERTFDLIAHGEVDYKKFLKGYHNKFEKRIDVAMETMEIEIIPPKYTGEKCYECKKKMV
jgi:DNA topoisomerase-1